MSQNIVQSHYVDVFPDGSTENQFFLVIFDPDGEELTKISVEGALNEFSKGLVFLHEWMDANVRGPLPLGMDPSELWYAIRRRQLDSYRVVKFQHENGWIGDQKWEWYLQMREGKHPASTKTIMEQK